MVTTSLRRIVISDLLLLVAIFAITTSSCAFVVTVQKQQQQHTFFSLGAKRRKNQQSRDDMDQFNRWYDKVDENASPDNVFWEEMERQKNQMNNNNAPPAPNGSASSSFKLTTTPTSSSRSFSEFSIAEERSTEAILASYAANMVNDNWLDERYESWEENEDSEDDWLNNDLEEQNKLLDEEIIELENSNSSYSFWNVGRSREPWDSWGKTTDDDDDGIIKIDPEKVRSDKIKDFLLSDEENDPNEEQDALEEEAEYLSRLSHIHLRSSRLESARNNPNAVAYFSRLPNEIEGYERMWISAIDSPCLANLHGVFRDYGVEFADNFGDWTHGSLEDAHHSIEDIASYKARQVFQVTGLPCIASRTSFEIEPVKVDSRGMTNTKGYVNPRINSGYKFNSVGDHVDYIVEAIKPLSDPGRVTRFRSCFCFYDGEIEIFDYGELDCDIYFCNSIRTYIPMSSGINEMCKTLQLTFGLEHQKWLKRKVQKALGASENKASMKLRDRVLKEGKVLPNDIIDVSAFMDSMVDVNLMDECASELSHRFSQMKASKILTVATTGLVIAIPMAKYLQVPVVYARKERNVVMSNTWQASYSSKTVGKNRELLVSKSHIERGERILIIDDFLSSGASQEALLRIVSDAGAIPVGVGVLLEKVYDAGRQALSGFDVPIESLVRVASVIDGVITLKEEEGFSSL